MEGVNKIKEVSSMPEGWRVSKLKYIATEYFKGNGITKDDIVDNGEIGCVRYADLYTKYNYHFSECEVRTDRSKIAVPRYFTYGALLFACTGELVEEIGKSVVYLGKDKCLAGGDLYVVNHSQDPLFMAYAMESAYIRSQKSSGKSKLKVVHISSDEINNLLVILPPYSQQRKIADYLNKKCSEIDFLSSDIQKEIETLEAYKKSLIAEVVTKGLNKSVPMKDSYIPWIGEIPVNWSTKRVGGLYSLRNEKVSDKDFMPLSVTMKGIVPQLETAAKTNDGDNRKLVRKGDFVINSRSDRRGSCGISSYDGSVSLINTVLIPRTEMNLQYYDWMFHTNQFADEFYKWGHGIVDDLWTTGWQEMKRIFIPTPPLREQELIASYLNSKCNTIDSVIYSKKQQLETLAAYKKSLIYEYVTGKKEVPAV